MVFLKCLALASHSLYSLFSDLWTEMVGPTPYSESGMIIIFAFFYLHAQKAIYEFGLRKGNLGNPHIFRIASLEYFLLVTILLKSVSFKKPVEISSTHEICPEFTQHIGPMCWVNSVQISTGFLKETDFS